jgi:two-component system, OmpR family, copper resistance phosphate regulon response regulator CusR
MEVSTNGNVCVLLIEDEKKLARSLERHLKREGYSVELAFDGSEAQGKLATNAYKLLILDINLPKMSGYDLLQEIRLQLDSTPVLILSARDTVEDRVKGLRLGADDYLVKPFDSGEFLARVEAVLRRSEMTSSHILTAGDLTMDIKERTVKRGEKEITLSPKEFSLLEFFLRNKNQVLTRKRIAEQVWGYHFDTGTNLVDVYVYYIREAIDKGFSKKLINTVRGQGFIMTDK